MNQFIRRAAHRARIGYLAGSFDDFNVGHIALLRQARAACDHLVVGVFTDEQLSSEGTPAAWRLADRLAAVRRCRFVGDALPQDSDDVQDIWRRTGFDILFTGGDWRDTYRGMRLERDVRTLGADVVSLSLPPALVSSAPAPPAGGEASLSLLADHAQRRTVEGGPVPSEER